MAKCKLCKLRYAASSVRVGGDGAKNLRGKGILFVGEAPGYEEDVQNRCFVGPVGRLLRNKVATDVGDRIPIRYTNAVRCYPGDGDVSIGVGPCRQYLADEIERVNPGRIIALGRIATHTLVDVPLPISQVVEGTAISSDISHVPIQFSYHPSAALRNKSLRPFFHKTLSRMMKRAPNKNWKHPKDTENYIVEEIGEALKVLKRANKQKVVAYDTEYNDKTNRVLCLAISWGHNKSYVFPDDICKLPRFQLALEELFENTGVYKVAHNWKYDARVSAEGMDIDETIFSNPEKFWLDTSTLKKLYHPEQESNLDIAGWQVGMGGHKKELMDVLSGKSGPAYEKAYNDYPDVVMRYCGMDSIACYRLVIEYVARMKREGLWALWDDVYGPLGPALWSLETGGVQVDVEAMDILDERLKSAMQVELDAIRASVTIRRLTENWDLDIEAKDFNPRSSPQMRQLLFGEHGLNLKSRGNTPSGAKSANKHVVKHYESKAPVLKHISEFNRLAHKRSTYVQGYRRRLHEDNKLHSTYRQDMARTGRLSSQNPNLQNLPNRGWEEDKAIRRMIVPNSDDEVLMEIDYSQIELRMAADLSGDPAMLECFIHDIDIHRKTAAEFLKCQPEEVSKLQRTHAKIPNFSAVFDVTPEGLQVNAKKEFGIDMTIPECKAWLKAFFRLYSGYRRWMIREQSLAVHRGCAYVYWMGKPYSRRWIPEIGSNNWGPKSHAKRQAINTPIQGGAALYMMRSLIAIHKMWYQGELPGVTSIMTTIHDSIVLSVKRSWVKRTFQKVGRVMVSWPTLRAPLEVEGEAGPNLADKKVIGVISALDDIRAKKYTVYVKRRKK